MTKITGFAIEGARVRGTQHPSARLTIEQVLEIRRAKGSAASIARKYGISRNAVYKIRTRQSWSWLNNDGSEKKYAS